MKETKPEVEENRRKERNESKTDNDQMESCTGRGKSDTESIAGTATKNCAGPS